MSTNAIVGRLNHEVDQGNGIFQKAKLNYYTQTLSYLNGGLTFQFPQGHFQSVPSIWVSSRLKDQSYTTSLIAKALVTNATATSATVRVNLTSFLGLPSEAADDAVFVSIWAIDN